MPLTDGAKNLTLNQLATVVTHIGVHTADGGASGANEVTGGGYARRAVTWSAASGGVLSSASVGNVTIPAATTVTHLGLWGASSGGTFYGSIPVITETFQNSGTLTVSSVTLNAFGTPNEAKSGTATISATHTATSVGVKSDNTVPAGTLISSGQNIVSIINAGSPGQIFNVQAGATFLTSGTLNPADGVQVWGLSSTNRPILNGQRTTQSLLPNSTSGTGLVLANLTIYNYGGQVQDSWSFAKIDVPRAINFLNWTNVLVQDVEFDTCDAGIQIGSNSTFRRVNAHHCRFRNWGGNGATNTLIQDAECAFGDLKPGGGKWIDPSWDAIVKFSNCSFITVDGWYAHDNGGNGLWFDINNHDIEVDGLIAEDNDLNGFHFEISDGYCRLTGAQVHRNGGAANIYISNSRGSAARPILIEDCHTSGHVQWEIGLKDNGNRTPALGYVNMVNNVLNTSNGSVAIRYFREATTRVAPGLTASGNTNQNGTPVGITGP